MVIIPGVEVDNAQRQQVIKDTVVAHVSGR
jgi:hypothetical protein